MPAYEFSAFVTVEAKNAAEAELLASIGDIKVDHDGRTVVVSVSLDDSPPINLDEE